MAFALPVPEDELGGIIALKGLIVSGVTTPYSEIKKMSATDDELVIQFKDDREDLVFMIEEGCAHQLLDLPTFIGAHLMQSGLAEMDETGEKIVNLPEFDFRKIRKSINKAYAFGK